MGLGRTQIQHHSKIIEKYLREECNLDGLPLPANPKSTSD